MGGTAKVSKTMPVMLRLDPVVWKRIQQVAKQRDLMPAQLVRIIMRKWLENCAGKGT